MRHRLVVAIVLIALVASACGTGKSGDTGGNGSAEKVTLKFWGVAENVAQSSKEIIKEFEKANPNISIKFTGFPESNYTTKIDTALAAQNPPDIGDVSSRLWMKKDKMLPLDDVVKQQNIQLSTWNRAIVGDPSRPNTEPSCSYGGKLYCLGSYTGAVMMLYNKKLLQEAGVAPPPAWPPMTLDQYVDMACKLTDSKKGVYGAAYGSPVTWLPWETVASPDGRRAIGYVDGPVSLQAHETLARGIRDKCAPILSSSFDPWEQGNDWFAKGKLATVISGLSETESIDAAHIEYGAAALPTPPGVEPFFSIWTDGVGVFKGTRHPEEAKRFVAFYGTQGQIIRSRITGEPPLDMTLAKKINWAGTNPARQEGLDILAHARAPVFIPNRWDTYGPIFDAFGFMTSGEKSAQDALHDAAPGIQQNLDKQWRVWDRG